jgi:hypothetical protein
MKGQTNFNKYESVLSHIWNKYRQGNDYVIVRNNAVQYDRTLFRNNTVEFDHVLVWKNAVSYDQVLVRNNAVQDK